MMYSNEMMLAYIASDVMKVGLSTKEKAKKSVYEIEAHCNHRSYRMCAACDQSAHSGLSCLYLPGTPRAREMELLKLLPLLLEL